MRRLAGLLAFAGAISACGGGSSAPETVDAEPTDAVISVAPLVCAGTDFQARSMLFDAVQAGATPGDMPPQLGAAIDAVPPALLSGLAYVGCSSEDVGGLSFEQMTWTNGIGLLLVAWQEWPGDGELVGLPLGGQARQAGVVEVSAMDEMANERTRIVHLFDGIKVVSVATFSLTTLSIEQAEEIAWAVYDAIPVDSSNRTGIGGSRTLADFLAALPSDDLLVGDPEGVTDMSPFTATMGVPHATYRFTVAGSIVQAYDFGAVGAADRAAESISSDGYTIAHLPYEVVAPPRYWQWDRLIIQYMGSDPLLIARLDEVIGPALAGGDLAE